MRYRLPADRRKVAKVIVCQRFRHPVHEWRWYVIEIMATERPDYWLTGLENPKRVNYRTRRRIAATGRSRREALKNYRTNHGRR